MAAEMMERLTLTIEEVAQMLGCGRSLAYDMARDGRLPVLRLGRKMVVPRVAVEKLLAEAGKRQDPE
jgi:excisionase family DNA binding protein